MKIEDGTGNSTRKRYYQNNKEICKSRMKMRGQKIKSKVFAAYSKNEIRCLKCGESDIQILHLDQIVIDEKCIKTKNLELKNVD